MSLTFQPIYSLNDAYSADVIDLYLDAFPEVERKPVEAIFDHINKKRSDVFALTIDDKFMGLLILLKNKAAVMIEYLAVHANARGLGIGSRVLEELRKRIDQPIYLEIEDPNNTDAEDLLQRQRRLSFYQQNGFHLTDHLVSYFGEPLALVSSEPDVHLDDYFDMYIHTFGKESLNDIYLIH